MKVKVLDQKHPTYDATFVEEIDALYQGGQCWRDLIHTWLPQHPYEPNDEYKMRRDEALYINHFGPIVDMLGAAVYTEAPAVQGFEAPWFTAFLENVDGQKTSHDRWFAERLKEALATRTAFAWVNLPARNGRTFSDRAAEEKAGVLDPFLVAIPSSQVIDWLEDETGKLVWLMVKDVQNVRATIDEPRKKIHRWTYIDAKVIRRWTWSQPPGSTQEEPTPEDDAEEQKLIEHKIGELPVIRLQLTTGLFAGGMLHDPAIQHIRSSNLLAWALGRAANALLVIKTKMTPTTPVLGHGAYLSVPVEGDVYYAEPAGGNFVLLAEHNKGNREELHRVVRQMSIGADSDATRTRMSAQSKNADWRAMDVVLSALAEIARDFTREVMRLVIKIRTGKDPTIVVTGLDGWQEEEIDIWLAACESAVELKRASPTAVKAIATRQGERLLQGADPKVLEEIRKEIEESKPDLEVYLPPPDPKPGEGMPSKPTKNKRNAA